MTGADTQRAPRRVLAVADSDSYVKWAAATLDRLPDSEPSLVVLDSPVRPSPAQVRAAVAGTRLADDAPRLLRLRALVRTLRAAPPDVLLVATTGPAAELVLRALAGLPHRPVVVTGLPGMSLPATALALRYRASADLFVVHSHREAHEFDALARTLGTRSRVVVNRLPFLAARTDRTDAGGGLPEPDTTPLHRVVFAPQAKFPETLEDRVRLLRGLAALAQDRPDLDVVVKLRGLVGEAQTHHEAFPFDALAARHADEPGVARLRVATGPLDGFLTPGTALVTVSSTALLEALALGLRALVLSDFGIGEHNLTQAYADSGLVGSLDDLAAARLPHADPAWLRENYLQDTPDELPGAVDELLAAPLAPLAAPPRVGSLPSHLRRRLRLAAPAASRRVMALMPSVRATRRLAS
ncbi:DUF6716 putative glycosyltransferase [Cellulomonas palmilytica]|uniref:DUF6716 putative glycosyltransferase n=1 Tax=Cellulomonas palmilytica TaxID=2608402 RepID=UPI001F2FD4FF|nr:DUF6716 putative glycosyltransferase [Cellulomonas palmilytica]UJP39562.1 hypothetical protein F1D97_14775 [Cellulomonas palmilytica]